MTTYKALMLGDVIGSAGMDYMVSVLPALIEALSADFVCLNAENASGGFGLSEADADRLLACGVDCLTSGNHIWEKKGISELLDKQQNILRPANYPSGAPGRGVWQTEKNGVLWTVLNLQGRESMRPIDSPFSCADQLLADLGITREAAMATTSLAGEAAAASATADADSVVVPAESSATSAANPAFVASGGPLPGPVLVDFHAESFEEKEALALYLAGRISVLAGTHTHIPTADERILPGGTGYLGDLGMCGPVDSVIGSDTASCLRRCVSQMPIKLEPAAGACALSGALFTIAASGHCTEIQRIRREQTVPAG